MGRIKNAENWKIMRKVLAKRSKPTQHGCPKSYRFICGYKRLTCNMRFKKVGMCPKSEYLNYPVILIHFRERH